MSRITHWRVHRGFLVLAAVVGVVYACDAKADEFEAAYKARLTPPAEYLHPYRGDLKVYHMPRAKLASVCHGAIACAKVYARSCDIILPTRVLNRFDYWTMDELYRHELGHCNGWLHE